MNLGRCNMNALLSLCVGKFDSKLCELRDTFLMRIFEVSLCLNEASDNVSKTFLKKSIMFYDELFSNFRRIKYSTREI